MTDSARTLQPGSVVDSLRVDSLLGQGSHGASYRVTDPGSGECFVLKEYLPGDLCRRLDDGRVVPADEALGPAFSGGVEAFVAEGRTVSALRHPNVVSVLRCFEANGTAYQLMPYCPGESLDSLLRRTGDFSAEEAVALARPLLGALEYMHGEGVIHRDIKPANIFISDSGDPLLLDFGAAAANIDTLGSEGYAAIEQYTASEGGIGPWTDIYGLAATLYRCMSGAAPVAAPRRQAALAGAEKDPLTPPGQFVTDACLAQAIAAGLAVQAERRPQSVRAWRDDFERAAVPAGANHPGANLPEGFEPEGREWLPIILLGLFFVALAAGLFYLLAGDGPGSGENRAAPGKAADARIETAAGDDGDGVLPASPEETARWQAALEADTAYGYQLFISDYPDSIHRENAQMHLDRLDTQAWQAARGDASRAAIEAYMTDFPGGLHEADARIALNEIRLAEEAAERARQEETRRDTEAWERARALRTLAALDDYLANWPGGVHADAARDLRSRLERESSDLRAFEAARKMNTIAAYQAYVDAFPQGARIAEALETIDDLTLRPGKVFRDCPDCPEMIVVPAGSFLQGTDESMAGALRKETPQRTVTFARPFAAGVFEITFAEWDACVADGGCSTRPTDNGWGRDRRPVIMVSWNDAQEYTAWLSSKTGQAYSLPSESQWEYVARAGEEGEWLGGDAAAVCRYGNVAGAETGFGWQHEACADPAVAETLPAGSLRPNAFGLHDVIGNVAEWTLDCLNLSYLDAPADGSAWGRGLCSSRMTRGGSWFTGSREIRLPARFNLKTGDRNDFTGLRVVRTVEPQ